MPPAPRGCVQSKALESQLCFFVQFKDAYVSTFQLQDLISGFRGEAQPFGEFTQLSAGVTLYDNSVYGNWLLQKGVAKVSGILKGSDFNVKSICEKLRKARKRKG